MITLVQSMNLHRQFNTQLGLIAMLNAWSFVIFALMCFSCLCIVRISSSADPWYSVPIRIIGSERVELGSKNIQTSTTWHRFININTTHNEHRWVKWKEEIWRLLCMKISHFRLICALFSLSFFSLSLLRLRSYCVWWDPPYCEDRNNCHASTVEPIYTAVVY